MSKMGQPKLFKVDTTAVGYRKSNTTSKQRLRKKIANEDSLLLLYQGILFRLKS